MHVPTDLSSSQPSSRGHHGNTTLVLAIGAGVSVAGMYYCQPLLKDMASSLHASTDAIVSVTVATQAGTAVGTLVFVPLGDIFERRRLIVAMCAASCAALLLTALAPTLMALVAASLFVGLTAMIPHLLIPFAAQLAKTEERGRVVGTVVGGLLMGILWSRTASGLLGGVFGWRTIYVVGGMAMFLLAAALQRLLPESPAAVRITYRQLLSSVVSLAAQHVELRAAACSGALLFGAFNALWTTLVFQLASPPFGYGAPVVGFFGLSSIAGAVAAPWVGRFVDRRSADSGVALGTVLTILSFLILWIFGGSLVGLAAGIVLLDVGVQAAHVSNQARLYASFPAARSRAITVYMMTYFAGGAVGSTLGIRAFTASGWSSVCLLGGVLAFLGGLVSGSATWQSAFVRQKESSRNQNSESA